MATYYCNIDNGTPSGNGTEDQPFNFANLQNFYETLTDNYHVFKVKGSYDAGGSEFMPYNDADSSLNIFMPWGVADSFDYWKVSATNLDFTFGTNEGTTVFYRDLAVNAETNKTIVGEGIIRKFYNCIFYGNVELYTTSGDFSFQSDYRRTQEFDGCTFYNGYLDINPTTDGSSATFNDCAFYEVDISGTTSYSGQVVKFNSCVFTVTSASIDSNIDGTTIFSDCTFEWVPSASMPSFADISASDKTNLTYEDFGLPERSLDRREFYTGLDWSDNLGDDTGGLYNYQQGSFYSPRFGPGSFYFTDIGIYVDLSASTSGHFGTSGDPFNWDDFFEFTGRVGVDYSDAEPTPVADVVDNDEFYLRGEIDVTNSPNDNKFFSRKKYKMYAWDTSAYGPWRIYEYNNELHFPGYELENGIIHNDTSAVDASAAKLVMYCKSGDNLFMRSSTVSFRSFEFCGYLNYYSDSDDSSNVPDIPVSSTFRGCTILCEKDDVLREILFESSYDFSFFLKDSVLQCSAMATTSANNGQTAGGNISADLNYVATNVANSATLSGDVLNYTNDNMQFGWTPNISWPNFSATEVSYSYDVLGAGITITGSNDW